MYNVKKKVVCCYINVCWPLPSDQSFYRQIAGYVRGVRDPRVYRSMMKEGHGPTK